MTAECGEGKEKSDPVLPNPHPLPLLSLNKVVSGYPQWCTKGSVHINGEKRFSICPCPVPAILDYPQNSLSTVFIGTTLW